MTPIPWRLGSTNIILATVDYLKPSPELLDCIVLDNIICRTVEKADDLFYESRLTVTLACNFPRTDKVVKIGLIRYTMKDETHFSPMDDR